MTLREFTAREFYRIKSLPQVESEQEQEPGVQIEKKIDKKRPVLDIKVEKDSVEIEKTVQSSSALNKELGQLPYEEWQSRSLADPRIARFPQFYDGLQSIVEVEGPIYAYRAYQIFARASGLHKIASPTKARFDHALQHALKEGLFLTEDGYLPDKPTSDKSCPDKSGPDKSGKENVVSTLFIRTIEQKLVRVRSLGSRTIAEVPPSELAEVMLYVRTKDDLLGRDEIYRDVLALYGLKKITALARRILDQVLERYF